MAAMEGGFVPAPPEFVFADQSPISLDDFEPLSLDELAKLEIYNFANCANKMQYYQVAGDGSLPLPWIENFGNQKDIVARLGMFSPHRNTEVFIDGPSYIRIGAWGHLLNEHYLLPIRKAQKIGRKKGGQGDSSPFNLYEAGIDDSHSSPRLFGYINGGRVN
jgi:hypothetical protein